MVWSSPRTWTVGELVSAAMLNTDVRDNLLYLGGTSGDLKSGKLQVGATNANTTSGDASVDRGGGAGVIYFGGGNHYLYFDASKFNLSDSLAVGTMPVPLSTNSQVLGSNGAVSANTDTDELSASLAAGVWLIMATITLVSGTGGAFYRAKIWDGTTVHAAAGGYNSAINGEVCLSLSRIVTLGGTTTIKLTCWSTVAATALATTPDVQGGTTLDQIAPATHMNAIRIG